MFSPVKKARVGETAFANHEKDAEIDIDLGDGYINASIGKSEKLEAFVRAAQSLNEMEEPLSANQE